MKESMKRMKKKDMLNLVGEHNQQMLVRWKAQVESTLQAAA